VENTGQKISRTVTWLETAAVEICGEVSQLKNAGLDIKGKLYIPSEPSLHNIVICS